MFELNSSFIKPTAVVILLWICQRKSFLTFFVCGFLKFADSFTVFNLGQVSASLTQNILFWRKMKLLWSHTDGKKKLRHMQVLPKLQAIIKVNFEKQVNFQAQNECARSWLSFQDSCIQVDFRLDIPCNSRRDWSIHFNFLHTLLCWSIHTSFVDVVLLFSFHYERTAKTKLIFTRKKIAVESEKHKDELDIRMAVNLEKTVQWCQLYKISTS